MRCTTDSSAARRSQTGAGDAVRRRRRAAAPATLPRSRGGSGRNRSTAGRSPSRSRHSLRRQPHHRHRAASPAARIAGSGGGARDHLPAGSHGVGRPLRQQRLAAGAAQAADEGHLGRDGLDHPQLAERARPAATATSIELRYRGNTARMPIFRVAGHPRQSVTVFFGYGRRMAGRVGNATKDAAAVQRLPAAHVGRALVRHRPRDLEDRRALPARDHAGTPPDGRAQPGPRRRRSRSTSASRRSSRRWARSRPRR